jgi:hypothetical protein
MEFDNSGSVYLFVMGIDIGFGDNFPFAIWRHRVGLIRFKFGVSLQSCPQSSSFKWKTENGKWEMIFAFSGRGFQREGCQPLGAVHNFQASGFARGF